MSDDPTPRQIAKEVTIFALLAIVVGAAFVAARFAREGSRVFAVDPRSGEFEREDPFEIHGDSGRGSTTK
ncbi:MAG: hypothetical protein K8T90_09245 [Planctomycetes bacterium]|nr:hypothetical protein [Planctomycetota bacterium]